MFRSVLPIRVTVPAILALCLTACGGGGGVPAPIAMSALNAPAQWPVNFKSVSIAQAALVTATDLAKTGNRDETIFIQVWYLNQANQRQALALLSLYSLNQMGGTLSLTNVPSGVTLLKSEVYTANGTDQLTLASKDIGV